MAVLLCELCGGALKSNGDGTYTCQSCGAEQIPDFNLNKTINSNLNDSNIQLLLAFNSLSENDYTKAINTFEKIFESGDNNAITSILQRIDELKECCTKIMACAIARLIEDMTVISIDNFFGSFSQILSLLDRVDPAEKERLKSSVVNVLCGDLLDELASYRNINLSEYGFNKLHTTTLVTHILADRVSNIEICTEDKNNIYECAIDASKLLISKNSKDLIRDKWGAYKYVPRLSDEEIDSLCNKIIFLENKIKED